MNILGISSARVLIGCICVGLAVASVYAYYAKGLVGKLIARLINADAFDVDSAKTLEELGCDSFVFRLIARKGSLQEGAVLSESGRFYIVEDKKEKILAKYSGGEESAAGLIAVLLIIAVLAAAIALFYPDVEKLLKSWF